jgi:nitrate/nitrite transport system ATP-binding protein
LNVDLPRPRSRLTLVDDPRYQGLRSEVLKFLYARQHKSAA